ncbi:MAG: hypothetical protein ABI643_01430 [Candidatus Doudnabacteria bacterium]
MQKILFIDASDHDFARLAIVSENFLAEHKFVNENLSERLILEIKKFFKKNKFKFSDLSKLAVVVGPGPFAKTRSSVAVANALGFGLGIKILPVKANSSKSLIGLLSRPGFGMVKPFYAQNPHITLAKKSL